MFDISKAPTLTSRNTENHFFIACMLTFSLMLSGCSPSSISDLKGHWSGQTSMGQRIDLCVGEGAGNATYDLKYPQGVRIRWGGRTYDAQKISNEDMWGVDFGASTLAFIWHKHEKRAGSGPQPENAFEHASLFISVEKHFRSIRLDSVYLDPSPGSDHIFKFIAENFEPAKLKLENSWPFSAGTFCYVSSDSEISPSTPQRQVSKPTPAPTTDEPASPAEMLSLLIKLFGNYTAALEKYEAIVRVLPTVTRACSNPSGLNNAGAEWCRTKLAKVQSNDKRIFDSAELLLRQSEALTSGKTPITFENYSSVSGSLMQSTTLIVENYVAVANFMAITNP